PFLADLQNACFYPPSYLLVLGGDSGLFLFAFGHCLFAFFGMRNLCAALQMTKPIIYLVSFSFLLCGGLTGRLFSGQLLYAAGLCYLPTLLLFAHRLQDGWN